MNNFPGRGLPPQRPIRSDFITYKDIGMSQSSNGHMPMQELSKPTTRFPTSQSLPPQRQQQPARAAQHFNNPHPGFQEELRRGQQVVEQIVPKFPPPTSPPPQAPQPERKEPPVNPVYNQAPPKQDHVQQVSEADIQEIFEFGKAEGKLEALAEVRAALLELINTMDFIAKEVGETIRSTPAEQVPPEYTYDAYPQAANTSPPSAQEYYEDTDHYNSQEGYYEHDQEPEMNYPSEDLYTFNPADVMPASGTQITQIRGMTSARNPQDIMVSVISQMMASQPQFHRPFPGVH